MRCGSALEASEANQELAIESEGAESVESCFFAIESIAVEVAAAAKRAGELGYPTLRVLREGWTDAS